ncbi:MAG: hypothetical protein J1G01_04275 [Clostridiales bacterium]|nr:hypothetical protein [Clostridiales bacterium]
MATSKEYRDFIVEQFAPSDGITSRFMMGEYLLYRQGVLFGGIYDGRMLVKITNGNKKFGLSTAIPYDGAKPMYIIEDVENSELMREIAQCTSEDIKSGKNK